MKRLPEPDSRILGNQIVEGINDGVVILGFRFVVVGATGKAYRLAALTDTHAVFLAHGVHQFSLPVRA